MSVPGAGRLALWARDKLNQFRGSLFGIPALAVAGGVVAAFTLIEIDRRTGDVVLPTALTTTVDSSRSLLGAITSGTISAASVVFSLTLVAIQLSSSSFSSRVVRTFLRDRFHQNVIGLVMGTFAYSMLVLRALRGPLEEGGDPFIPRFSILVATVLALAAILGLIGSINHTAQNLRASTISARLVGDMRPAIEQCLPRAEHEGAVRDRQAPGPGEAEGSPLHRVDPLSSDVPSGPGTVLTSSEAGWIQQISISAIVDGVAEGSTVRIDVAPGRYVYAGAPLLTLWPQPDLDQVDSGQDHLRGAFAIGSERSLQQDLAFGFVLLEDIAVRALSPGVNDPNTAREVIPQLGEMLMQILTRPLPPMRLAIDGCEVIRASEAHYADYVAAAFAQTRRCASGQPEVMREIIDTTGTIADEMNRRGEGSAEARAALAALAEGLADDVARVQLTPSERGRLEESLEGLQRSF